MRKPEVTIIILNWNGRMDTIECLESLKRLIYANYRIMIVDNGSTDGSVESLKRQYHDVELVENGRNLGFAEGNNVGIRKAIGRGTDYVLLLNNDTIVDPGFLDVLVAGAEKDALIGIVGPMICYYDTRNLIQSAGASVSFFTGVQTACLARKLDDGSYADPQEVDLVSGCALLAKREVFEKVGYLNPNYFLYWEETDWCIRARRAGYHTLCIPTAKIWHKESSTAKKIKGLSLYYLTRNRFWFMKHNATALQYIFFLSYYLTCRVAFFTFLYLIYYRDANGLVSYCRGVFDGIVKRSGPVQPEARP